MTPAAATLASFDDVAGTSTALSDRDVDAVRELQERIRSMQATKLDSKLIPTHPALASLLPGGGLKQGAMYSIENSATLLLALLAEPSRAGSWCGVIGVPEFGVEAAASFGVDLERLVLVPNPGDQWLAVTAAIADVLSVVVLKPPARTADGRARVSDGNISRLAARLRQRGSTLIVAGSWPQGEAMLSLSESSWSGIGTGFGHLTAREVTVTVSTRLGGRPKSARMWLPDDAGVLRGGPSMNSGTELPRSLRDSKGALREPQRPELPQRAELPQRPELRAV